MQELISLLVPTIATTVGGIFAIVRWAVGRLDRRFDTIDRRVAEIHELHRETISRFHEMDVAFLDHEKRLDEIERSCSGTING